MLLAAALPAGCRDDPGPPVPRLDALLPAASELEGWRVAEGPVAHGQETLFEYLNGGAERYLSHGFRRLLHVRFQLDDDPLAGVTLDLYDMGSELGAFGIYSAGRWPEVETRPWGVEGYRYETVAVAWKGRVFVHGEADDGRPALLAMLDSLVARAADGAPGDPSPPAILSALPAEGLVAGSERYVPADLLGHSFLPGGVTAIYEIDGRRAEVFFSEVGSEEAAVSALSALREDVSRRGRWTGEVHSLGDGGFRFAASSVGHGTAVRSGAFLAGVQGRLSAEEGRRLLTALLGRLPLR